eukprot:Opistho-2@60725
MGDDRQGFLDKAKENVTTAFAIAKVVAYATYRRVFKMEDAMRPEISVVAVGLDGTGKTSALIAASGEEPPEVIEPTRGFGIKAIVRPKVIFNVKELGGAKEIRPYWNRYFEGADGFIFVAACDSDSHALIDAAEELKRVAGDSALEDVPALVLLTKSDVEGARGVDEMLQLLFVEEALSGRPFIVRACTATDPPTVIDAFDEYIRLFEDEGDGDGGDSK